jgi:GT2 family glycosyltransferase
MDELRCTLIIPTHKPEIYRKWEESIKAHPAGELFELVKIDTSLIPVPELYWTKLMNDAMKEVQTEYICTTNDDAYPLTDNWLTRLIDELEAYKLAIISPFQVSGSMEVNVRQGVLIACSTTSKSMAKRFISGACVVFRTAQARAVDFWDENYRWTLVDVDFSYRMEAFGLNAYTMSVIIEHNAGTTASREDEPYKTWGRDTQIYHKQKWAGVY